MGVRADYGATVETDFTGNVYLGGRTAAIAFPTTVGAYQTIHAIDGADNDGFITKLTSSGQRLWSTLYGGNGNDWGCASTVDKLGNPYLCGYTSSSNFPCTAQATQSTLRGLTDMFFVKFNDAGSRIYATLLGGNGQDYLFAVDADSSNSVVFAGSTNSISALPITSNAYQNTLAGSVDAVVGKVNDSGALLLLSLLGGGSDDIARFCFTDTSSNIFVVGHTSSPNFPVSLNSINQTYRGGSADAFVTKFSTGGSLLKSTFIGGSDTDRGYSGVIDKDNNLYICGESLSSNLSTSSNCFQSSNNGNYDGFLYKISNSLEFIWGTYYGGFNADNFGGTVLLKASIAQHYKWNTGNPADTNQTIIATIATVSNYQVQTALNGCQSILSAPQKIIAFQYPPKPTINASQTTICETDSVIITAPSGFKKYLWNTGDTTQTIKLRSSGNISVQVTDSNGCKSAVSDVTTILVNPIIAPFTISANSAVSFCQDDSVIISAPVGYSQYLWSTSETTQNIKVKTSGNYNVVAKNVFGCSTASTNTINVEVFPKPSVTVITLTGSAVFCLGDSVILSGPTSANKYLWSTGDTTRNITIKTAENYDLKVTNQFGCVSQNSLSTTVLVNTTPIIYKEGSTSFCIGDSVKIFGLNGYSHYLWSTGDTTASIQVKTAGNYSLKVTNSLGCVSVFSLPFSPVIFPKPSQPTISSSGPTTFCLGDSTTLIAPVGYATYKWNTGATSQTIKVKSSGNYSVIGTNANGCESPISASTNIIVNPIPPTPIITPQTNLSFCQYDSVILTAPTAFGYLWTNGATTNTITVKASGTFGLMVYNINGCQSPLSNMLSTVMKPLPPQPFIVASGPTAFCIGDSVILSAPTSAAYHWNNNATTQSITVKTTGSFSVMVTGANGCQSALSLPATTLVRLLPLTPIITANKPTSICNGDSLTLTASSATAYLWNTGETSKSIKVKLAGTYYVHTFSQYGCRSQDTANLNVIIYQATPTSSINASGPTTFCVGDSVILTSSIAPAYRWSTGATSQSIKVKDAGVYSVSVINNTGCFSAFSLPLTITTNAHPPLPTILPQGVLDLCSGDSVRLVASPSAATYLWTTGQTSEIITVKASGTFGLKLINQSGCISYPAQSVNVRVHSVPDAPVLTFSLVGEDTIIATPRQMGLIVNQEYIWKLNGNRLPETGNRLITGNIVGTYTANIIENGCISLPSSISLKAVTTKLYPNPFSESITIAYNSTSLNELVIISCFNDIGQQVINQTLYPSVSNNLLAINTNSLAKGMYILKLQTKFGTTYYKMIKQ